MTPASEKIKDISVSDFMTKKVKTITENETLRQACKLMYQENIGSVVILKEGASSLEAEGGSSTRNEETPVGILTERDIARMVGLSAEFFADMNILQVMSKPLITISANSYVKDAAALMDQKNIRRLPVVDYKGQIVGIITAKDILKAVIKESTKGQEFTSEGFDLLGLLGAE